MTSSTLPSVSVILPAFRQEAFLCRALDSVRRQSYRGVIEAIVIDDGSPDQSAALAEAHPLQPKVLRQPNGGVSSARNAGIEESAGDYLAFLDADDAWHESKLERQMALILSQPDPRCLSMTRYRRVNEQGAPLEPGGVHPPERLTPNVLRLMRQNFIGTSTVVAHRACFEQGARFPQSRALLKAGQDYALWLELALDHPMVYLPEVLTDYTVHRDNRVGADPLKHHAGGVHALRYIFKMHNQRARQATGLPLEALIAYRCVKLVYDLIARREQISPEVWRRLLPTLRASLSARS